MSTQSIITPSATGTVWTLDAAHSEIAFAVRHLMISTVRGRFSDVEGTLTFEEAGDAPSVQVSIATDSVDTGVDQRDAHLKSGDFFDAGRFPAMTFRSRRMEGWTGEPGSRFRILGDLTIRDATRPVSLDATFEGRSRDPWGGQRMGFTAVTTIDRHDFGLDWNQALETGGVLVSREVKISLEVQLVEQAD